MSADAQRWDLTDQQRTRLLDMALHPDEPGPGDEEELKGDLLCDLLRMSLPDPDASPQDADEPVGEICPTLRCLAGPPIGEVLCAPATSLDILLAVKQYAKNQGTCAESQVRKDVYLVVYFAAIASALAFHNRCITQHTKADVSRFIQAFARMPWIPADLASVFKRAIDCGQLAVGFATDTDATSSGRTASRPPPR